MIASFKRYQGLCVCGWVSGEPSLSEQVIHNQYLEHLPDE